MSRLWYGRGARLHQLGLATIGAPAVQMGPRTGNSFNVKLADDAPIVNDGNNYAAKVARQARYSNTAGNSYYSSAFQVNINYYQYDQPLWVMPAGYPTRKIYIQQSFSTNGGARGDITSGSPTVVNITGAAGPVTNGMPVQSTFFPEFTTLVSGAGTSTWTMSNNAIATRTQGNIWGIAPDSNHSGLQAAWNHVPVPRLADMPSWWAAQYGTQLQANGSDGGIGIYSPSTNQYWDFWIWYGNETAGYCANYGGYVASVSTNNGWYPNGWGASAAGVVTMEGTLKSQEYYDEYIPHALAIGLCVTAPFSLAPSGRFDSSSQIPGGSMADAVPEGAIFRFLPNIFLDPAWPPMVRMIVIAIRDYGLIPVDTSGNVSFQMEDARTMGTQFNPGIKGRFLSDPPLNLNNFAVFQQIPWEQLVQVTKPSS